MKEIVVSAVIWFVVGTAGWLCYEIRKGRRDQVPPERTQKDHHDKED